MAKQQTQRNRESRAKKRELPGKASAPKRAGLSFAKPAPGDEVAWLLAYLPAAYPLPFGQVHHDIIAAFRYSMLTGGNMAAAAPRGTGKSTLVNGLVLMALLEGQTKFPAVIPWDDKAKKRALRFWANELCFNARIHRVTIRRPPRRSKPAVAWRTVLPPSLRGARLPGPGWAWTRA